MSAANPSMAYSFDVLSDSSVSQGLQNKCKNFMHMHRLAGSADSLAAPRERDISCYTVGLGGFWTRAGRIHFVGGSDPDWHVWRQAVWPDFARSGRCGGNGCPRKSWSSGQPDRGN